MCEKWHKNAKICKKSRARVLLRVFEWIFGLLWNRALHQLGFSWSNARWFYHISLLFVARWFDGLPIGFLLSNELQRSLFFCVFLLWRSLLVFLKFLYFLFSCFVLCFFCYKIIFMLRSIFCFIEIWSGFSVFNFKIKKIGIIFSSFGLDWFLKNLDECDTNNLKCFDDCGIIYIECKIKSSWMTSWSGSFPRIFEASDALSASGKLCYVPPRVTLIVLCNGWIRFLRLVWGRVTFLWWNDCIIQRNVYKMC